MACLNNSSVWYFMMSALCSSAMRSTASSFEEKFSNLKEWSHTMQRKSRGRVLTNSLGTTGGNHSSSMKGLLSRLQSTQILSIRSAATTNTDPISWSNCCCIGVCQPHQWFPRPTLQGRKGNPEPDALKQNAIHLKHVLWDQGKQLLWAWAALQPQHLQWTRQSASWMPRFAQKPTWLSLECTEM